MSDNEDTIATVIGGSGVLYGSLAVLAPDLLSGMYGMSDVTPGQRFMARLWGCALGAVGALLLTAGTDDERRRLLTAAAVSNAAVSASALLTSGLPGRTKVLAAGTAGGLGALAASALR